MTERTAPLLPELLVYGPAISPFVRAVRLYAQELGLPHRNTLQPHGELIPFKSPGHLALNPFGKAPVLLHGDLVLFETTTICRYLETLAGANSLLHKLSSSDRAHADQWAGAVAANAGAALMNGLFLEFAFPQGKDGRVRLDVVADNLPRARAFLDIIEQPLRQHACLAGTHYSMADSLLTPMLDHLDHLPATVLRDGPLLPAGSVLGDYLARMRARPSAQVLTAG